MSDATLRPFGPGNLPLGVEVKDGTVNVSSLDAGLMAALAKLGRLHLDLFNAPLVITSANDGKHAANSKHYANKAVDVRTKELRADQQLMFGMVIVYLAPDLHLMLFDERQLSGSDHFHLETAD